MPFSVVISTKLEVMELGFFYRVRKSGEVSIVREGREVTVLRGAAAANFLKRVETEEPQLVMARVTGNYKRGNERQ